MIPTIQQFYIAGNFYQCAQHSNGMTVLTHLDENFIPKKVNLVRFLTDDELKKIVPILNNAGCDDDYEQNLERLNYLSKYSTVLSDDTFLRRQTEMYVCNNCNAGHLLDRYIKAAFMPFGDDFELSAEELGLINIDGLIFKKYGYSIRFTYNGFIEHFDYSDGTSRSERDYYWETSNEILLDFLLNDSYTQGNGSIFQRIIQTLQNKRQSNETNK